MSGKLTKAREVVLRKIVDGGWHPWDAFTSANSLPSLRRTAFGRGRGRVLPWNGTGQPMLDAGWIEMEFRHASRLFIRITPAGRALLTDTQQGAET